MGSGRTHQHRTLRAQLYAAARDANAPCGICGQTHIDYDAPANTPDAFEMDHILARVTHPELEFEPSNLQPAAHRCNRAKNASAQPAGIGITSEDW